MTNHAWRSASLLTVFFVACSSGGTSETCSPTTEICNGRDDDCDGRIDEELGVTTCGVGICQRAVPACDGGQPGVCVAGAPATEVCNGLDDDCDGTVDEGCECQVGQTQACYSGPPGTVDVGSCHAGTQACVAGQWGACDGEQLPVAESCNAYDDDCNGQVDDGLGTTSCGVGACARTVASCEGGLETTCTPGDASAEVCDGVDNDCNGSVDDGNPGGGVACATGQPGACAAGTTVCSLGAIVCRPDIQPAPEVCNGLDDDCEGTVDNGNPGGGGACSTGLLGVCASGTMACASGALNCEQNVQASAEVCNGLDDDCDGAVDEGNPGGGSACSTGLLGVCAAGTVACSSGALTCQQNVTASAEVCDGRDNDCDGQADEGNPGGGLACNTGLPGVCAAGATMCTSGALTCVQSVQPSAEICGNGLDDDCDGIVDEC